MNSDCFFSQKSQKKAALLLFFPVFCLAFLLFLMSLNCLAQEEDSTKAIELFNQGQDAHEKGDLKAAIEFYQKALKIFPEFPEAEYQLGVAFQSLGEFAEAEKAFRRALELREDWTLAMVGLGAVLVQNGKFDEAEAIIEKALELDGMNPPALVTLTDLRLKTNASPEILKDLLAKLQFLTSKAKPTASVWAARASVERRLGDRVAAKQSVLRALALEPTHKAALAEKAEIELAENDYQSAFETAQKLLRVAPESIGAKFLLARALAANGNADEALKALDEIKNPTTEIRQFRDKIIDAKSVSIADLEKQLASDPKDSVILGRLCSLLRTKNPLQALDYCRRAVEADPKNMDYVIGFGAALVQARQFESAVNLFRKVLEVASDNYTARANLAVALFQLKRYAEAKTEYLWLSEKQPDLAITYYFLGIIHDQLKEYADAMANYQQFLRLADTEKNKLEIDKVNLRLPVLQRQLKRKN
jgi:tetratricopeptide (TPR) repeat protein